MLFPTTPEDHHALQAEIDAELAVDPPPESSAGRILTWMTAHGSGWLETGSVLHEEDFADFEAEPPTHRAAIRIQDRLEVVSPGEPHPWLSASYEQLGGERPLDLLRRGEAAPVLILLDELALIAPPDHEERERQVVLRLFREAEEEQARKRAEQRKRADADS